MQVPFHVLSSLLGCTHTHWPSCHEQKCRSVGWEVQNWSRYNGVLTQKPRTGLTETETQAVCAKKCCYYDETSRPKTLLLHTTTRRFGQSRLSGDKINGKHMNCCRRTSPDNPPDSNHANELVLCFALIQWMAVIDWLRGNMRFLGAFKKSMLLV